MSVEETYGDRSNANLQAESLARLFPHAPEQQLVTEFDRGVPIERQIELYARDLPFRPAADDEPEGYAYDSEGNYYCVRTEAIFLRDMGPLEQGQIIDSRLYDQMQRSNPDFANNAAASAKREVITDLYKAAWWRVYKSAELYTENPFEIGDINQQVRVGNDKEAMTVHNFGEDLEPQTLQLFEEVINDFAQQTNQQIYNVVSNIVIHESFADQEFAVSGKKQQVNGRAYPNKDFIELNGKLVHELQDLRYLQVQEPDNDELATAVDQAELRLKKVLAHEIGHKIDAFGTGRTDSFEEFFRYEKNPDPDDARLVITPLEDAFTTDAFVKNGGQPQPLFCGTTMEDSVPVRDYGHTNMAEDFATAVELFVLTPHNLDKPRLEALSVIFARKFGVAKTGIEPVPVSSAVIPREMISPPGLDNLPLPTYIALHLSAQDFYAEDEEGD